MGPAGPHALDELHFRQFYVGLGRFFHRVMPVVPVVMVVAKVEERASKSRSRTITHHVWILVWNALTWHALPVLRDAGILA